MAAAPVPDPPPRKRSSAKKRGRRQKAGRDGGQPPVKRLRRSPEFRSYEEVRSRVAEMLSAAPREKAAEPSACAAAELDRIEYLFDASPLIIARLREHWQSLGGAGTHDLRLAEPGDEREIRRQLDELARAEDGIGVGGEPPILGASGLELDGELHNAESLLHHRCLLALGRASVLTPLEQAETAAVWQIGGGSGGFAYQFKSLFPDVTFVISDHPARFLFSATYLMTAIPEASFGFAVGGEEVEWDEHDFVFVPHGALDAITPPSLDLAISIHSFEEMSGPQVDACAAHAYERGCPYVYSFDRDRQPGNTELKNSHNVVARYYWPHEVPVPRPKQETGGRTSDRARIRHVIGWRRLKT